MIILYKKLDINKLKFKINKYEIDYEDCYDLYELDYLDSELMVQLPKLKFIDLKDNILYLSGNNGTKKFIESMYKFTAKFLYKYYGILNYEPYNSVFKINLKYFKNNFPCFVLFENNKRINLNDISWNKHCYCQTIIKFDNLSYEDGNFIINWKLFALKKFDKIAFLNNHIDEKILKYKLLDYEIIDEDEG